MNTEELEKRAQEEVKRANPGSEALQITNVYENFLDGTLVAVTFQTSEGRAAINHVLFGKGRLRVHRLFHDVCVAVAEYRESRWFFRFLELVGVQGLISLILILFFAGVLSYLAIAGRTGDPGILEIIKLAFTAVLGFFFGSQVAKR